MALPTITNNSPVAGSIAWTGFGIQYNGVSYTIPPGNTAQAFVWWLFNGGAPALQTGNALPVLGADDMILFLNKAGTGVLVPTAEMLDGSLIVGGSILAGAIGANQIQTSHLAANSVTATQIAANSVTATDIVAGAVTTDKLGVGTVGDSLVTNGSFEEFANGMPIGWLATGETGGGGVIDIVTGVASSGTNCARLNAPSTTAQAVLGQTPDKYIPVSSTSGRKWYISARIGVGTAITSGMYLRAVWYDAAKVFISNQDTHSNVAVGTTFAVYEGQVTPPAAARYMSVSVYNYRPNVASIMYVDEVTAREVVISAVIGDGAITTPKIVANAVTATQIAAKAVTADKLTVSDFTNYAPDPSFESGGIGWSISGWTIATIADPIVTGTKALQVVGSGAVKDAVADSITVREGEWYYASCYVRKVGGTGGTVGTVQLGATVNRTAGGPTWPSFQSVTASSLTNAWVKIGGPIQIPALATSLQIRPSVRNDVLDGTYQFDDVQLRRMDGGELVVDGVIVASKIATDAVTSTKIIANAITTAKIAAGAVTATQIAADTITANEIAAGAIGANEIYAGVVGTNHLVAGAVTANKLESELVLATKIIAGSPTGTHAEMSNQGFRVYADDPTDGIPNEVVRLGVASTDDYFAVTRADGSLAASISQDGVGSFASVTATNSFTYKGTELQTKLDALPRGPVYKAELSADIDGITTKYGLVTGEYVSDGTDRQILVEGGVWSYPTSPSPELYVELRYTVDGTMPTINSTLLVSIPQGLVSATTYDTKQFRHTIRPTSFAPAMLTPGTKMKILMLVLRGNGAALNVRGGYNTYMYLTDIGKGIPHTAQFTPAGGSIAAPPPPVIPQQTYVKQYGCTVSANYDGSGNRYTYNDNVMYQGLSPAGYGNLKSIANFADMTGDLSGSTINYVRVIFDFQHWYYNNGGTARIGVHGHTGIPGTDWGRGPLSAISTGWPKPGSRWVELSSSHWNGFKTGEWRGVYLEGDSTYTTYGYSVRPTIEISYTK